MGLELFFAIIGVVIAAIAIILGISHILSLKDLQKKIDDPFLKGLRLMGEYKWRDAINEFNNEMKEAKAVYLVKFCNLIGLCYYLSNELDSAFENYSLSLSLAKNFNDKKGEASALSSIALIFMNRGDNEKAYKYFEDALRIFTNIGSQREIEMTKDNLVRLKGG